MIRAIDQIMRIAGRDGAEYIPTAVDAALDGRQFLSGGLLAQEFTTQAQTTII
jgi:hypothetical protein